MDGEQKTKLIKCQTWPISRTRIVSYSDMNATHRVEVTATSLYKAVVLAIKAMNISQNGLHLMRFRIEVKAPVVWHEISGSMLRAWLAGMGRP